MNTQQSIQSISELTPVDDGVYQIRLPLPFALDHINVYLIEDSDGWILVDTGIRSERSQSILKSIIDQLPKSKPLKAA